MKDKTLLTPSAAPSSYSFTTMRVRVLIAAHMVLLAATANTELEHKKVNVWKCCDVHKMLSSDGDSCVEARWPSNFSIESDFMGNVLPPLDSEWVRRWLPPGLPIKNIRKVFTGLSHTLYSNTVSFVNASSLWDPALLEKEALLRDTVAFLEGGDIARPKPGGGYREALYCVDAAPPPLGPFALRLRTVCRGDECVFTCCGRSKLIRNDKGRWKCEADSDGSWTPVNSSLSGFDPEFPFKDHELCVNPRLLPFEQRYAKWARHTGSIHHFHYSTWETCFGFYRSSNDSLLEGVFSCEYPRITRGVYWLLRPLCFLSALMLTASLLTIACDKSMRQKIHGRCLACHAACLLLFNIGQAVYYISLSDYLDEQGKDEIPADHHTVCKNFALSMYFVLTSAWFWLTALCVNMASGFRLHMPRLNKESGKRFLAISAFAWGLPAVLTITCSIFFTPTNTRKTPAWHTPSLMETRTCYIEPLYEDKAFSLERPFMKTGTALFYYGPVFCLVLSNIVCLVMTLRKVQYLKRGNSVLRREEDQIPLGQRGTKGKYPPTAYTATGNAQTPQGRNRRGTAVDAKTIKLYIKMVLLSGGIELLTEFIMWITTHNNFMDIYLSSVNDYSLKDRDLANRAAGYVTDFFRAAVVTWLAAPEGGYLHLIKGMVHRDRQKKSPGAGNASRRKQNVA